MYSIPSETARCSIRQVPELPSAKRWTDTLLSISLGTPLLLGSRLLLRMALFEFGRAQPGDWSMRSEVIQQLYMSFGGGVGGLAAKVFCTPLRVIKQYGYGILLV